MTPGAIINKITREARKAAGVLSLLSADEKNNILFKMAEALNAGKDILKKQNRIDIKSATNHRKSSAFIDRLRLDDKTIDAMCVMMREVASLKDPIGDVLERRERPNGLLIEKVRVPIGVIGIIYESRPNVTADSIALCLKSANAVILRGGKDAINSNKAIYNILKDTASKYGLACGAFTLIENVSRKFVEVMLKAVDNIDLIMPRGGESLIKEVMSKSKIPVIKHYKGICHIYVDSEADLDMAERVCFNAKVQRPGVCNAMETLLVHEDIASDFLPRITGILREKGVKFKVCARSRKIIGSSLAEKAKTEDFATEWLALVLNVRVVKSLQEAVEHISKFGSKHSDAIITKNQAKGIEFTKKVDSAAVYINASTRFTDGGEFGKGAEIGISTDKLHARGPVGLEELTTYKYIIYGNGQVRT